MNDLIWNQRVRGKSWEIGGEVRIPGQYFSCWILIVRIAKDHHIKDFIYDMSGKKIKNLNWKSKTSIEKGILETKKWIDENFKSLKKVKLKYNHYK